MTYVIPRFTEFFADFDADLPLLTVVVLGIATFLRHNFLVDRRRPRRRRASCSTRWFQTPPAGMWLDAAC